tara:strand:- start:685 stop:1299 length:615 start_codon:yes stop_codon:yes gene_type:complete
MKQIQRSIQNQTIIQNRRLTIDLEKRKDSNGRDVITQIAIYDVDQNQLLDHYLVKPDDGISLHKTDLKIGFTERELTNAKSIAEIDMSIRSHLRGSEIGFWNMNDDLRIYPGLLGYALKGICLMKLYSSQYGPWDPEFCNRSFVKLVDAASNCGFVKDQELFWHDARVDASATAFIWRWFDQQNLPKAPAKVKEIDGPSPWDLA